MDHLKKIVLAYSRENNTSVIFRWLQETYDREAATFTAELGQDAELEPARAKARPLGVEEFDAEDVGQAFVRGFVLPTFRANALGEGTYLLGSSTAQPLIGKRVVEMAWETGADEVAHVATGKGNDQASLELDA